MDGVSQPALHTPVDALQAKQAPGQGGSLAIRIGDAAAGSSMGTPKKVMVEQLEWFGKEVIPAFKPQKVQA